MPSHAQGRSTGTLSQPAPPARAGPAGWARCAVTFSALKPGCTGTSAPAHSRQSRASTRLGSTAVILALGAGSGQERLHGPASSHTHLYSPHHRQHPLPAPTLCNRLHKSRDNLYPY